MPIRWTFRKYLSAECGITTALVLQQRISQETGVVISTRNLNKYLSQKPKVIRLETLELICSALKCKLSKFLQVTPKVYEVKRTRKLAPNRTPRHLRSKKSFPEPGDYPK